MLASEILHEKDYPNILTGEEANFEYKGKTYAAQDIIDAAKAEGSLFRKGKKGLIKPVVKTLQAFLHWNGYNPGKIDGWYGKGVAKAVRNMQKDIGAKPDGDVGPETASKMIKAVGVEVGASPSNTVKNVTDGKFMQDDVFKKTFRKITLETEAKYKMITNQNMHKKLDKLYQDHLAFIKDNLDNARIYVKHYADLDLTKEEPVRDMYKMMYIFDRSQNFLSELYEKVVKPIMQKQTSTSMTAPKTGPSDDGTPTTKSAVTSRYLDDPKAANAGIPDHSKYMNK